MLHRAEAVPEPISFRHVISLGHILDEAGEKMSKSKGNVVDPWTVLDQSGADALRWYCYVASPAGNPRRFSPRLVSEAQRRFLHTLWNTYSFFVTYANIDGWRPDPNPSAPTVELDRWIISELHALIGRVTEALDDYDPTVAAREIDGFVDSLSNWYVRRSRRRFWSSARGGAAADLDAKRSAYQTLHTVLTTLAKLLAPMTPYLAEDIWRNLAAEVDASLPESVHLADWPVADAALVDETLNREMQLVQRVASLGRSARSGAGIKVRQPLPAVSVAVRSAQDAEAVERHRATIAEELNVKTVTLADAAADSRRYTIKPNLRVLGPKLGPKLPSLRSATGEPVARTDLAHRPGRRGGPVDRGRRHRTPGRRPADRSRHRRGRRSRLGGRRALRGATVDGVDRRADCRGQGSRGDQPHPGTAPRLRPRPRRPNLPADGVGRSPARLGCVRV